MSSDILSMNTLTREFIASVHELADKIREIPPEKKHTLLQGKIVTSLFFEPSTRTRESFRTAAITLGATETGFGSDEATSAKKSETLADTIRIYEGNGADVIILRHPRDGAAQLAADVAQIPLINAGDGQNQHPTQALLDLYTIKKIHGTLDGINIALVGDLKYGRTVHSLLMALGKYQTTVFLVSPEMLKMPKHIISSSSASVTELTTLEEVLRHDIDVLYMTRIQKERFPDETEYQRTKGSYKLTSQLIAQAQKPPSILHPLPRVDEMDPAIDALPSARYFEQARYGVPVRQALLCKVLGVSYG